MDKNHKKIKPQKSRNVNAKIKSIHRLLGIDKIKLNN